jgi:hypothetical protein
VGLLVPMSTAQINDVRLMVGRDLFPWHCTVQNFYKLPMAHQVQHIGEAALKARLVSVEAVGVPQKQTASCAPGGRFRSPAR